MAVQAAVLLARMAGAPCARAEQSAVERPLHGVLNDTRQYREQLHASEAKPEAQLGDRQSQGTDIKRGCTQFPLWIHPHI